MMETLIDTYGEARLMLALGLGVGLMFGAAAYLSRFCLRAATAEVAEGRFGPKLAIWLVAFTSALALVQVAIAVGALDIGTARQLAATGSISGAVIGGLMFGAGMILARGCVSRLLVLSASGNLRAILTGLVVTLSAQASLRGVLAPSREWLFGLWTVPGGPARAMADYNSAWAPLWLPALALAALILALAWARISRLSWSETLGAAIVGLAVYAGWQGSSLIAGASFEVIAIQSVTFTGPSTDTLMALVNTSDIPMTFGLGLVPGVFLGALMVALIKGEARIQRFDADTPMERYLIGGTLMGFGSMLAGGCAVGAGMTGGAILALTAWLALFSMWIGAMAMHRLLVWRAASAQFA